MCERVSLYKYHKENVLMGENMHNENEKNCLELGSIKKLCVTSFCEYNKTVLK